jgi:hypothetical protein
VAFRPSLVDALSALTELANYHKYITESERTMMIDLIFFDVLFPPFL